MLSSQQGKTSSASHVAAVLGSLACLVGCANTAWTFPVPFVRSGSSVVYLKTKKQTQSVTSSWKDWSVHTVVDETRYRAIDLRTCAKVGDFSFPGAARVLAWDAETEDLWVSLDSSPGRARSMHGRSITLPGGIYLPTAHEKDPPTTRILQESASGVIWLWRIHAESMDIIARDAPPIAVVVSAALRTVAVLLPESGEEVELLVVDEIPGGTYAVTRLLLPVKAPSAYSATLLRGGAAIAFVSPDGLEIFELASGQRSGRYPSPVGSRPTWGASSPLTLAYANYDRDINQAGCSAHISMFDVERGRESAAASTFAACFASLNWIAGSQMLLAETQSVTGIQRRWLLDIASGWWISAPDQAKNWQGFGKTVIFDDGAEGSRHLASASPELTAVEPLTGDLGDVRFVTSEPASHTTVVTSAPDELFLYHVDSRHLDRCANL